MMGYLRTYKSFHPTLMESSHSKIILSTNHPIRNSSRTSYCFPHETRNGTPLPYDLNFPNSRFVGIICLFPIWLGTNRIFYDISFLKSTDPDFIFNSMKTLKVPVRTHTSHTIKTQCVPKYNFDTVCIDCLDNILLFLKYARAYNWRGCVSITLILIVHTYVDQLMTSFTILSLFS